MKKGQNLTELAIILAVIVIAGIAVYSLLGGKVHTIFSKSVDKSKEFVPFGGAVNPVNTKSPVYQLIEPGSLGGTSDSPVTECNSSSCNIDFGEFVLQGIPSDLSQLIETSGTSAGQKELLSLIEQIAQQLEEDGEKDGAQQYRDLANLGHFLAQIESEIEKGAESCKNDSDSFNCMRSVLANSSDNMSLPDNLKHLIPDFDSDEKLWWMSLKNRQIGAEQFVNYNNTIYYSGNPITVTNNPSVAMLNTFNDIMSNDSYSDNMKAVTQELYNQLSGLHTEFDTRVDCFYGLTNFGTYYEYIPYWKIMDADGNLTKPPKESVTINDLSDFTNPQYSLGVNLDSAIICATGHNTDSGIVCD